MNSERPAPSAGQLFASFVAQREASDAVSLEEFCARYPEHAEEIRQHFEIWDAMCAAAVGRAAPAPDAESATRRIYERLASRPELGTRYEIEGEVAKGGMGSILKVWDLDLQRHLAMKIILDSPRADSQHASHDEGALARFLAEAQVTSQLDHPGVVPVHDLGLDPEGRTYFTMKIVKGDDLSKVFQKSADGDQEWTQTRLIGVILKVCEAMAYAHEKKVIHRDLKPANIMVGRFGEVFVMDWGLARVLDKADKENASQSEAREPEAAPQTIQVRSNRNEDLEKDPSSPLQTRVGDVLGTPAYMSPEQASGRLDEIGPQSDVYSVGALLYHLLAGHAPYAPPKDRVNNLDVWRMVKLGPPQALDQIAKRAPAEIVAVCEKAMARDLSARYANMTALADDLRAYLEGRVVRAYETGAVAELRKWIRRNRGLAAACLAAVLALVVGLVVSLNLQREAVEQRRNVFHLAAYQELEGLRQRSLDLWPVTPARIDDYEAWLRDAEELLAGLDEGDSRPGHHQQLARLRQDAKPGDAAMVRAYIEKHPRYADLESLEKLVELRELAARVRGGAKLEGTGIAPEIAALPPVVLDELAWPMVDPDRRGFGRESEGLALARLAVARAGENDPLDRMLDTLAWACACVGLDDEAIQHIERAVSVAKGKRRRIFENKRVRLEDTLRNARSPSEAKGLARLKRRAARLRDEITVDAAFEFDDERTAWWHNKLSQLVRELEDFADPETGLIRGTSETYGRGVEWRLEQAKRIRTLGLEDRESWKSVRAELADNATYASLDLPPQSGLLPLGRDPASGLQEFAHIASGDIPARGNDGRLVLDENSCIVMVLLPAGSLSMGAQKSDPQASNYDEMAQKDEAPIQRVELDAFFLAKHEMTQAQWQRLTAANPSTIRWGRHKDGQPTLGTNPVETISWKQAVRELARIDLTLPTEAQWEYAARARTSTRWSTGAEASSLEGHCNLADLTAKQAGKPWRALSDAAPFADGFTGHAPIGSFAANPYGLHDMHGNVQEWCLDLNANYHLPPLARNGERTSSRRYRNTRGGSYLDRPRDARTTYRFPRGEDFEFSNLGIRPARALRNSPRED